MSGISGLEQNMAVCVIFSALGGILEVFATGCLAYPAARMLQGFQYTDRQLKTCLAANIFFQILASLSGNLFATWFGPVSIVGPTFFAAQLLANLVLFWIVLGIEAFSREMQVGTYVIVVAVVLLLVTGPVAQEYTESFEDLVIQPAAAIWTLLLVTGMITAGAVVMKARIFNIETFEKRNMAFKFAVLLTARASAFALNLTSSKAFLVETTAAGYAVSVVIKVVSGAIYTMAIVVQSTAVEQRNFVPINAATTIVVNAVTGMLVWKDWKVVQSWPGYVCVFLLLILGCALLLGDLSLLQESAPETFRGGRFAMTLGSNRQRLLENLRNVGGIDRTINDEEVASPFESLSTRRQEAWTAIYETGGAVPKHSISTRTMRRRRDQVTTANNVSRSWSGPATSTKEENSTIETQSTAVGTTSIPTAQPQDFKFTKGTCALSWWRPIKLLEEGSISDIHLVKRRNEFVTVKYKEKREVMDLAKRKTLFSREESEDLENDENVMVLKSIIKSHIGDEEVLEEMRSEILVMSHLRHPNIVRLYEAYERHRHVYLIMEYCPGGNLTRKDYNERQCSEVVQKLLSALQYMHSQGVAHRDIKLENIMIDRFGEMKLIDFGLATKYQSKEYTNLTDTVGTLYSMAPQVLEGIGYDFKADLWSVGVVSYLLLSRVQPFWGPMTPMSWPKRRRIMMDLILKCKYAPMVGGRWDDISKDAKDFVASLLQHDPKSRPTAAQALESKWIRLCVDSSKASLEGLLERGSQAGKQSKEMKSIHYVAEFRRRAWRLLTTRFSLSLLEQLESKLSQLDDTGNGFVQIDTLLMTIQEIGASLLTSSDMNTLNEESSLTGHEHPIEYIDFIDEVKRGRERNIIDNLAASLDTMDVDNSRQVTITEILSLLDTDMIPEEIREDFRSVILPLRDFYGVDGTISTVHVLHWIEKRMARQQSNAIEDVDDSFLSSTR